MGGTMRKDEKQNYSRTSIVSGNYSKYPDLLYFSLIDADFVVVQRGYSAKLPKTLV